MQTVDTIPAIMRLTAKLETETLNNYAHRQTGYYSDLESLEEEHAGSMQWGRLFLKG